MERHPTLSFFLAIITLALFEVAQAQVVVNTLADENESPSGPSISLREAISNSSSDTIITFGPSLSGGTITLTNGQLLIPENRSITIDASALPRGITIDANELSRVLKIELGAEVVLSCLTLTGGRATGSDDNGGCIFSDRANLTLADCTLSDNFAESFGGGIYSFGRGSRTLLRLDNCTLTGNSAPSGGAILIDGFTGQSPSSLVLNSCTVSGNSASSASGGVFSFGGSGSVTSVFIQDTILAGNSAPNDPDLSIIGTSFTASGDNLLTTNGSNLATLPDSGITEVDDPLLSPLGNYGGPTQTMHPLLNSPAIISVEENASSNRIFAVLTEDQRGFSRDSDSPDIGAVEVGEVVFVENEAELRAALSSSADSEGMVIRFGTNFTPTNGVLALEDGPLIIPGTAQGLFIDAFFPNSVTIDAGESSRVFEIQPNAVAALQGLTIVRGRSEFDGGGILNDRAHLTLNGCTLNNNSAERGGGAIFTNGTASVASLHLSNCNLSNNSALSSGGAIFSEATGSGMTSTILTACQFSDNVSTGGSGGGVASSSTLNGQSFLRLTSCDLFDNRAFSNGGGIDSSGISDGNATLTLKNCLLRNNTSSAVGGGIASSGRNGSTALILKDCTLSENSARDGGAISSDGDGGLATATIDTCSLAKNSAENNGGGLFSNGSFSGSASIRITASTLSKNSADNGAGIFNQGSNGSDSTSITIDRSTLFGNFARLSGGGIFNDGRVDGAASLFVTDSTLAGNVAGLGGGVVNNGGLSGSATLSLENTILGGNVADRGPDLFEIGSDSEASTTALGTNLLSSVSGSNIDSSEIPAGIIIALNPLLSPLGDFGGPTQTSHPLAGSAAIRMGTETRFGQRGVTLSGPPSIGAVQVGEVTLVSNENSLRLALADTSDALGRFISLADGFNNITLSQGQLTIPGSANGLFVDASGLAIDAAGESRILEVEAGASVSLQGLTMTGGNAKSGGAVLNSQGELTLNDCTLVNNLAVDGGGIFNDSSQGDASLTLNNCRLSFNTADFDGGGIFNSGSSATGSEVLLRNCTVSENNSVNGGAIANLSNGGNIDLTLDATTLSRNTARFSGGGISSDARFSFGGIVSVELTNCTLSGNSALDGGGIFCDGRENGSVSLFLNSCTLTANSASNNGGGIAILGSGSDTNLGAQLALNNTILASNNAPSGPDLSEEQGATTNAAGNNLLSNLTGQSSLNTSTLGLIINEPLLSPLGSYGGPTQSIIPLPGSPAIDAALTNIFADQRGLRRPRNDTALADDIGAAEFQQELSEFRNNDGDSIDDRVELLYFADSEALAGDPASRLRIVSVEASGSDLLVTIEAIPGYQLTSLRGPDVNLADPTVTLLETAQDFFRQITISPPVGSDPNQYFGQVRVEVRDQ